MLKRSKTSGRIDDAPEIFEKGLREFEKDIGGILEYYQKREKLHIVSQILEVIAFLPNHFKIDCNRALSDVYAEDVIPLVTVIVGCPLQLIRANLS